MVTSPDISTQLQSTGDSSATKNYTEMCLASLNSLCFHLFGNVNSKDIIGEEKGKTLIEYLAVAW